MENVNQQERSESPEISEIGAGITVTGDIEATVDLQIEGKVHGDVRCTTLILGEAGLIKGSVHAERVRVSGVVEGSIETKDLAIESSARVAGDVTYSRIRIANGGIIHGHMKHNPNEDDASDAGKLRLVGPQAHGAAKAPAKPQAVYIE